MAGAARVIVAIGVHATLATGAPAASAAGVGSWQPAGSMLGVHYDNSTVALAGGRVLALGEVDSETATETYDPGARAWTRGPSLPERTNGWTVVALADGGALLIGADTCAQERPFRCVPSSTTRRLSPDGSAWLASTPMNVARGRPLAVALSDGRVLVAGGFGDDCTSTVAEGYSCKPLASAEIYDPATNSWSATTPMPSPRGGAAATLMSNGTVLVVGGSRYTRDALRYTPGSAEWTTLRPPAFAHTGSALIALPGNRAITLGEDTEADFYGSLGGAGIRALRICQSSPELYTTANDTWTLAPPLPTGSIACSTNGALLAGGQILYSALGGVYLLDPHQLCWSVAAAPADDGQLAPLPNGGALDFDEQGPNLQPLLGSETYTPGPPTCLATAHAQALIFSQLQPSGLAATITSIAEHGYRQAFNAPGAGHLVIEWLAGLEPGLGARPVLAAGEGRWPRSGARELKIALTSTGKASFGERDAIGVTVEATFTPVHGPRVRAARSFTLRSNCPPSNQPTTACLSSAGRW